tara:strand:+ start:613 stop:825 length:213 start_codon:yes stop_codon:yes gene_type:complete
MTKSKKTQAQLLEEISYKLTVIIDQLGNILDYQPPVEDDNLEEQYPEQVNNNRGDYSSLFGVIREDDLDA